MYVMLAHAGGMKSLRPREGPVSSIVDGDGGVLMPAEGAVRRIRCFSGWVAPVRCEEQLLLLG